MVSVLVNILMIMFASIQFKTSEQPPVIGKMTEWKHHQPDFGIIIPGKQFRAWRKSIL